MKWLVLSLQHVFAMVGATVLVPLLTGLDVGVALVASGGMTIILYGLIAGNGVKVLIRTKVNFGNMRNLIIVATMLVIGLGGAGFALNDSVSLTGMSLAAVVGILLNLVLPKSLEE